MRQLTSLAETAAQLLKARGETIAVSESSTGGLISAALLAVPGASSYYMGGGIIYTQAAREQILEIDFAAYPGMRSSSEPYATLGAETIRQKLSTTWGLAETGAAGPSGNRYGDAAGHTCVAIAGPASTVITLQTGLADREANMWLFAERAFSLLVEVLEAPG
jgi:PncC family amidohydrolase